MSIEDQMNSLIAAHRLPCSSRKVLQGRHIKEEFSVDGDNDDTLFYRFARVVCRADKIPRKELFEAWGMALQVHENFPSIRRFADLACGHGLVSWALLALYHYGSPRCSNEEKIKVSAVCIDINMPLAAERLHHLMLEEFPELDGFWHYVEGTICGMIPAPQTLLVGVHACKNLSDIIISNAIYGNSSLALVPCCHAKGCLTEPQQAFFDEQGPGFMNLAAYLDGLRIQTLEMAGFQVTEARIHEAITPKNRLIVARPPEGSRNQPPTSRLDPSKALSHFCIPLEDSEDAKSVIASLSGKDASRIRKAPPAVSLGLVLLLRPGLDVSADQIRAIVAELCLDAEVEHVNERIYHDKCSDAYSRTFRVVYLNDVVKESAKAKHIQLCRAVEATIPGVRINQIPRLLTVLELEMYLPIGPTEDHPYLEISAEDISKALLSILPSGTDKDIHVKRVGNSTFCRRSVGRHVRLFKLHYSNILQTIAIKYHEEMKKKLSSVIPGVLIL